MRLLSVLLVGLNQLMSHPLDPRVNLTLMRMMVTPRAPVRGHVLSPTGNTTKKEKTFQWLKLLMVYFAVFADNGLIQPQQQRVREVSGLMSLSQIGKRRSKR